MSAVSQKMLEMRIVVFMVLVGTSFGQVINLGSCPEIQVVQDFDAHRYLGKWYEYSRYFAIFEIATKCNSAEYSLNNNGSLNVVNRAVGEISGAPQEIVGFANIVEVGKGELSVYFPSQNMEANYYILGTDYDNWAVVFSCKNFSSLLHARFAWLLTRSQSPSENIISEAKEVFKVQNISSNLLFRVNQDGCQ